MGHRSRQSGAARARTIAEPAVSTAAAKEHRVAPPTQPKPRSRLPRPDALSSPPPVPLPVVLRRAGGLVLLVCAILLLHRCAAFTPNSELPAPGSPDGTRIRSLLARTAVVPSRTHRPGYERGCGSGEACVFGPAWSDATDAPLGHNGCDTRNDVLAADLIDVHVRPGTGGCVVVSGTLDDPYTGRTIAFRKADAIAVQIDHVYPLAAAWDMGAHAWSDRLRRRFANDADVELLAVDGPANQRKSDGTPQDWVPDAVAYRCFYAAKYLSVAVRYSLPITAADRDVLDRIADRC